MNVAILGFGTVGKGVYDILNNDFHDITIKAILVKHPNKHLDISKYLVKDISEIIEDDSIDVVIEVIGGKDIAYNYVRLALSHRKHVITANKALVSEYFKEIHELARNNYVQFRYEASVGAAINIIDPLNNIRKFNKINKIAGIINGSTNFILSKIFLENQSLTESLKLARSLGYIETDASDDLDGFDLLRKINILSMIAYSKEIKETSILRVSLASITDNMIAYLKENNLCLKYIAISLLNKKQISIQLEPVVVNKESIFYQVNYEENCILLEGEYHKKQVFIGQGAGRYPTASAVVYDLLKIKAKETFFVDLDKDYQINKKMIKSDYLVEDNQGIKRINNIYLKDLLEDTSIKCFARIGEIYV